MDCDQCGKSCKLEETIYKIKHKGKVYCFCSPACKERFQKEKFGEVIY